MKVGSVLSPLSLLWALFAEAGNHAASARPSRGGLRQRPGPKPFGPDLAARFRPSPTIFGRPSDDALFGTLSGSPDRGRPPRSRLLQDIVENFAQQHGFSPEDYFITDSYTSDHNKVTHVYLRQIVNGVPVANGEMNLNIDSNGRVLSYGDSFYRRPQTDAASSSSPRGFFRAVVDQVEQLVSTQHVEEHPDSYAGVDSQMVLSPRDALVTLSNHLNLEIKDPDSIDLTVRTSMASGDPEHVLTNVPFTLTGEAPTRVMYIQTQDGRLELAHQIELEMHENWYCAHVSAVRGRVLSLVDWTSDATYTVFPLGYNDPRDGPRVVVEDPADEVASPLGWHSHGRKNYTMTIGNNVYAHENLEGSYGWENNHRPDGGEGLIFNHTVDFTRPPKESIDAAITNLFYWNNIIHDLFYRYGFDEKSGNFQESNFERGGKGGDAVIANAQDGSGYNNANFATPPDGQRPKMRMYVWNVVVPYRDGDFESGIIMHEYAHGISTRLTGGPANSNCLGWGEAGGMGEGWGDFFATVLRMKPSTTRRESWTMGDYANGGEGIRRYPYSTDKKTNPETFAVMDKPGYWGVHAKGAVWAEMLFEVYWNLVDKHGFSEDWFSASTKFGNTLMLQLVIDGMKLQPCRPTFIQARDAILQADEILTGGQNQCEIWEGFAKRGLGLDAKVELSTPWGEGARKESFRTLESCDS